MRLGSGNYHKRTDMHQSTEELSAKFQVPGLRFESGRGGLTKATLETSVSVGEIYLHGAHVTGFQLNGQKPLLWMSKQSLFQQGKAIRGGVPICFPWFGPHPLDPQAPGHGWARIRPWDVTAACPSDDGGLSIELQTKTEEFTLTYTAAFGRTMELTLKVELSPQAPAPVRFEEALHTYFSISDISDSLVEGLEGAAYIDKVDGSKRKPAAGRPIRFSGECDRVYLDTMEPCLLRDPGNRRSIVVSKSNSKSTVVWNPWIAKSARMADFGDNEWPEMVCIEAANVGPHSIELAPGQSHQMGVQISLAT